MQRRKYTRTHLLSYFTGGNPGAMSKDADTTKGELLKAFTADFTQLAATVQFVFKEFVTSKGSKVASPETIVEMVEFLLKNSGLTEHDAPRPADIDREEFDIVDTLQFLASWLNEMIMVSGLPSTLLVRVSASVSIQFICYCFQTRPSK